MLKQPVIIIIILAFQILFNSCNKDTSPDCFKSNGKDLKETRYPGIFNEIIVRNKIDITIIQSTEFKVEIIAGKNLLKKIETLVNEEALVIDNKNTCNFVRGYKRDIKMFIYMPYLKKVLHEGVGTVNISDNFNQDTILVRAENSGDTYLNGKYKQVRTSTHGNGDIYAKGSCNSLYVYANGTNFLYADNLIVSDYVFAETLSLGDCFLNTSRLKTLEVNIHAEGNIFYSDEPGLIINASEPATKGKLMKK